MINNLANPVLYLKFEIVRGEIIITVSVTHVHKEKLLVVGRDYC
jgi:hypothetical protein